MATEQELFEQLRAADAKGDTAAATALAQQIRAARGEGATATGKFDLAPTNLATKTLAKLAMIPLSLGKGVTDAVGGVGQLAAHAMDPRIGQVVDEKLAALDAGYGQLRDAWDPQAKSGMPDIGRFMGSALPAAKVGGLIAKAAPAITGANTIGGTLARVPLGAVQGAAAAAMQPVSGGEEFWDQKSGQAGTGAVIGGAVPLAVDMTRGVMNFGKNVFSPMHEAGRDRIAQDYEYALAGKNPAERTRNMQSIIDRAKQAKQLEILPGQTPTVGGTLAHTPPVTQGTGVVAHENYVSQREGLSPEWSTHNKNKLDAMRNAIKNWAKSPADLAKAQQDARDAANLNFKAAESDKVLVDKQLLSMFKAKQMKEAFKEAENVANLDIASGKSKEPFLLGKKAIQQGSSLPVRDLHRVKMSLDTMIGEPEKYSIDRTTRNSLIGLRDAFTDWLKDKSSLYKIAETTHQKMMTPVDRMKVGQYMLDKLDDSLGKSHPKSFADAADDLPETIRKATGFTVRDASQKLTPSQIRSTELVAKELARKAQYKDLAGETRLAGGLSDQPYGVEGSPFPSFLNYKAAIGNKLMRTFGRDANEQIKAALSDKYQHPLQYGDWMQKYIDALPIEEKKRLLANAMTRDIAAPLSATALAQMQNLRP